MKTLWQIQSSAAVLTSTVNVILFTTHLSSGVDLWPFRQRPLRRAGWIFLRCETSHCCIMNPELSWADQRVGDMISSHAMGLCWNTQMRGGRRRWWRGGSHDVVVSGFPIGSPAGLLLAGVVPVSEGGGGEGKVKEPRPLRTQEV